MGTPKVPDHGIDLVWQDSNQNRWLIKCQKCNEWICLDENFPECIHYKNDKPFRACIKCGAEVYPRDGKWVPKYPSRWDEDHPKEGICGFWPTQLISSTIDLDRQMKRFNDPRRDKGEFYNSILGVPYMDAEDYLVESDVFSCCTNERMLTNHPGPCAMGIDNDKVKHIVIGYKSGKKYVIVKVTQAPDKNEIHDLIRRFNVKSMVIDALPNQDSARELQVQYKGRLFMCFYMNTLQSDIVWRPKEGIVKVNRTVMFDETHQLVKDGFLKIPYRSDAIEEFARQVCSSAKFYIEDEITGDQKAVYMKRGRHGDHYRNALNYFKIACRKIGHVKSSFSKKHYASINNYERTR